MVKAILCAGLFPNVVRCKTRGSCTTFYTKNDGRVEPKASSVISPTDFFPHPWLVYTTKVQGTCYVQDLTIVSDYALLMFGGSLHCMKDKHLVTMMGGFLKFVISRRAMTIVQVCLFFLLLCD
jgi:ATP-dependent RNA helicase DHX36